MEHNDEYKAELDAIEGINKLQKAGWAEIRKLGQECMADLERDGAPAWERLQLQVCLMTIDDASTDHNDRMNALKQVFALMQKREEKRSANKQNEQASQESKSTIELLREVASELK